jgi:hypothetical protein
MSMDLLHTLSVFSVANGSQMYQNSMSISCKNTFSIGELAYGLAYHAIAVSVAEKLLQFKK